MFISAETLDDDTNKLSWAILHGEVKYIRQTQNAFDSSKFWLMQRLK